MMMTSNTAPRTDHLAYCKCKNDGKRSKCRCGEDRNVHEWSWDAGFDSPRTLLFDNNREVLLHPGYSIGTAAVRGDTPFEPEKEYYWEIKFLSPLYGTDVMVGVGTSHVQLTRSEFHFCSLLGGDKESWGFSYQGTIQHNGVRCGYGPKFGQGSIVGIRVDMWKGTLEFYLNRVSLGLAYTNLNQRSGKELYPMVSSTSANSCLRVIYSTSCNASLQLQCLKSLCHEKQKFERLQQIPGFRQCLDQAFWWLTLASPKVKGDLNLESKDKCLCLMDSEQEESTGEYLFDTSSSSDKLHNLCPKRKCDTENKIHKVKCKCICNNCSYKSNTTSEEEEDSKASNYHYRRLCLLCDVLRLKFSSKCNIWCSELSDMYRSSKLD